MAHLICEALASTALKEGERLQEHKGVAFLIPSLLGRV